MVKDLKDPDPARRYKMIFWDYCDPINGDSLRHRLNWQGKSVPGALVGKKVSLLFEITGKARLFAFSN